MPDRVLRRDPHQEPQSHASRAKAMHGLNSLRYVLCRYLDTHVLHVCIVTVEALRIP